MLYLDHHPLKCWHELSLKILFGVIYVIFLELEGHKFFNSYLYLRYI